MYNYDGSLSQFGSQQIQKSKSAHQFCSVLALTVTNKCEARRKYLTPAIHSGMPSAPPPLPCTHLFCGIPHCNCTFYFIEKSATQAIFVTEKWGETANLRGFLPRCNLFARVRLLGSYIFGHTAPLSHLSPLQNVTTVVNFSVRHTLPVHTPAWDPPKRFRFSSNSLRFSLFVRDVRQ